MEGEVIRYAMQGVEMSFRAVKGTVQAGIRLVAFLKALSSQLHNDYGEKSKRALMKKGEAVNVGTIPQEKSAEFARLSKDYGLPYYTVKNAEIKTTDIMFRVSDMPKFNAIFERLNILKNDLDLEEYKVEDVRESVLDKLERYAKQHKGKEERTIERQISGRSNEEISGIVKNLNINNPAAYTPENWQAYLEARALMYDYSENNTKLIYQQRPAATLVLSKSKWAELGRQVDADKGIEIKMPVLENGKPTGVYKDTLVYDAADTTGVAVSLADHFPAVRNADLEKMNDDIAQKFKIELKPDMEQDAIFDPSQNTIFIRDNLSRESKFKALQRESIHASMFAEQGEKYTRENNRFLADSTTYAISTRYGLDAAEYKFEYLPGMMKVDPKKVVMDKERISKAFAQLSKDAKRVLDTKTLSMGER